MHSHKLRPFFADRWPIILIIAAFVIINVAALDFYRDIGWDSSVYIGMGKYVYSSGSSGLWEPIRPLTLPLLLGFFWKIGLDPLVYGELSALLFSVSAIILTYLISMRLFGKAAGIIASAILSFSALMIGISHEILAEIPAVLFMLLGFYFYISDRNAISGICLGLAFLTKFPSVLFLFALIGAEALLLLLSEKKFRPAGLKAVLTAASMFAITISPYFLFNHLHYGDAFFPLESAKHVIDNAVGCTVFDVKPFYYYPLLLLKDNPLHIFFILGACFVLLDKSKRYKANKFQIVAYAAVFFVYFSLMACKTDRYPLMVLPFISMITGYGLSSIIPNDKRKRQMLFILIVILVSASSLVIHLKDSFMKNNDSSVFSYFKNKGNGEILTTTPQISVFTDSKLNLIYYSIYNSSKPDYYTEYIIKNKKKIDYIFININNIPCHPNDIECPAKTQKFVEFLKNNFRTFQFDENPEYFIFYR